MAALFESVFGFVKPRKNKSESDVEYEKNIIIDKRYSLLETTLFFFVFNFVPIAILTIENLFGVVILTEIFLRDVIKPLWIFLMNVLIIVSGIVGQNIKLKKHKDDILYIKHAEKYLKSCIKIYRFYMSIFIFCTIILILNK